MATNPYDQFDAPVSRAPAPGPLLGPADPFKQADERRADISTSIQLENLRLRQEEAARKREEADAKRAEAEALATAQEQGLRDTVHNMRRVVQAAKDAKELSRTGWFATGFGAQTARDIGGTAAADVSSLLNTIGANTAFDRLQKMRDESKTGGALGQVSEIELQLLRDSVASLDQSQSDAQFQSNMDKVIDAYQRVIDRLEPTAEPAPSGDQREDDFREGLTDEGTFQVRVTDDSPAPPDPYQRDVEARMAQINDRIGQAGVRDLLQQGFTLGLSDEAAGVGGAISGLMQGDFNVLRNYQLDRDAEEMRLNEARDRLGWAGTATEMFGGLGVGGAAKGLNTIGQAARAGAEVGAVGGFGYGRGLDNSAGNAFIGGAGGALLGAGGAKLGQIIGSRQGSNAALGQRAQELAQAGQAEGVTVNRAMVDPRLANRVTGADASLVGGPRIQRGMEAIEGQIEGRVRDLGRGGAALNAEEAGGTIRGAAERFIDRSGRAAKVKYDRAEKLAGNVKIEPRQSLQAVDQMIAQLSETGATNSAEIAFLQGLRSDLSQELSVGALRRLRTSLRKRISRGELTFGEDEARVLSIMDTAADDIRTGLTAQGNARAARAFDAADKAYRARMEYINDTVQKVVGRRNANKTSEQVFTTFSNMAKGKDAAGLRKFYATLNPDEAGDVAATFAAELGRDSSGQFSVARFLTQSEKFSDSALTTLFGKEGAQSINNLRVLGKEVKRVTSAMNSRKSGSGVANEWRSVIYSLISGGLFGSYSGSFVTAAATASAVGGTRAAADILSSRALMSPKITKWLRMAPKATTPQAINRHFEQLGAIARAEPSLAPDVERLQQAILRAANDNVGVRAAASDGDEDQGK